MSRKQWGLSGCVKAECAWSVQVRNLPQPSFPAWRSQHKRVRECAWVIIVDVSLLSRNNWCRSRPARRTDWNVKEILLKNCLVSLSPPSSRKPLGYFGYRAVENKTIGATGGYSKFIEDAFGAEMIVMLLTKENRTNEEKFWNLWVWDTQRDWIRAPSWLLKTLFG